MLFHFAIDFLKNPLATVFLPFTTTIMNWAQDVLTVSIQMFFQITSFSTRVTMMSPPKKKSNRFFFLALLVIGPHKKSLNNHTLTTISENS
jgi:hypothetical protein